MGLVLRRKEEAGDGELRIINIQMSTEAMGVDGITLQANVKREKKSSGLQTFAEVKKLNMIK